MDISSLFLEWRGSAQLQCGIFLAAVLADAVNLKGMPGSQVAIFTPDFLLHLTYITRKKFDRAPALGAYHVVMAAPVVLVLIACDAVVEGNFAGQSALRKQFQRTVNGRVPDAPIFFLHQAMQLVGGEVITGLQKGSQDAIPLRGLLQPNPLQ